MVQGIPGENMQASDEPYVSNGLCDSNCDIVSNALRCMEHPPLYCCPITTPWRLGREKNGFIFFTGARVVCPCLVRHTVVYTKW